jgi:glycosyltransferase involved in cell wall biosynthesis
LIDEITPNPGSPESADTESGQLSASDVAVIVPVGGAAPAWNRCLQSLADFDPAPGEIVVVIDGRNDDQAAALAEIGAKVVVLEERGGPARARNNGVENTEREILLFIDSDIEVPTDLVARVAEIFTADRELTAIIGSYDDAPGDPAFLSQYRNLLHHFVHQEGRETASTFWAGCGAIRRLAFREAGGFDESYPVPSIEDIELGSRLVRSGHTIRLVKELQVKHLKQWRLADMLATDLLRRAAPWTELMLREREMVNDLNVKTRDRVSVFLAFTPLVVVPTAAIWPPLLGIAAATLILLGVLNHGLLRFLLRRRGLLFTLGAMPLYWAYLIICGLGFALGLFRHLIARKNRRET